MLTSLTGRARAPAPSTGCYVSDSVYNDATIFGPPGAGPPFITDRGDGGRPGKSAETLPATIVPLGHDTTCTFQYVSATDFNNSGYANATTVPCHAQ